MSEEFEEFEELIHTIAPREPETDVTQFGDDEFRGYGVGGYGVGGYGSEGTTEIEQEYSRARFEDHIKSPFDTRPGSQWDRFMWTFAEEFGDLAIARNEALVASYVDTATGKQLDKLGTIVQLPRRTGEPDQHYRHRLKAELRTLTSGGTIEDLKKAGSALLDANESDIAISEPYETEPARVDLEIDEDVIDDAAVTVEEFASFLSRIKAAGVRLIGTMHGNFTYRTVEDFNSGVNDSSRGYNELDADGNPRDIGGGYSTLIHT